MPNNRDVTRARAERERWWGAMVDAIDSLPPEQRAEFDKWDANRPAGVGTSAWPGFVPLIGAPPWAGKSTRERVRDAVIVRGPRTAGRALVDAELIYADVSHGAFRLAVLVAAMPGLRDDEYAAALRCSEDELAEMVAELRAIGEVE